MAIEAVLFDFGGVVVDSPFPAFRRYETTVDLPPGVLRDINSRNPDTNAWAELERGALSADEFAARFAAEAAQLGATVDGGAVLGLLLEVGLGREHARPGMLDAVARCRTAGLRVGVLTNNARPMRDSGGAWAYDEFDVVIESCLVGLRKPDAAVYELACTRLGADAAAIVMLDDLGINLKPARALGMQTIKVGDPAVAIAELDRLLSC